MLNEIMSILTDSTCGHACWFAKEDICRCRCNGRNHGCLLTEGNEQPVRTKKSKHRIYELVSVVSGYVESHKEMDTLMGDGKRHYHTMEYDKVGDFHSSSAQKSQFKWKELVGYSPDNRNTYLIWKRII